MFRLTIKLKDTIVRTKGSIYTSFGFQQSKIFRFIREFKNGVFVDKTNII